MQKLRAKFRQDNRGSIAIMFGLTMIVLGAFSGVAIDISRAYGTSSFVSSTTDQIALAVAQALSQGELTDDELQEYAQQRYTAALSGRSQSDIQYGPLVLTIDADTEAVTVSASGVVDTFFAGLVGHSQIPVNEQSVVSFKLTDLDVSLMLDITGSMNQDGRIDALKTASRTLIDLLIPKTPNSFNRNRIALAPFSAGINLGSVASEVTEPGNPSVDNCVVGRSGSAAHTDAAPGPGSWIDVVNPATVTAADDIDPLGDPDLYTCPEAEIFPLSNKHNRLLQQIDNLNADGTTAGHLGVEWAWYLISPEWASVWPSQSTPRPYDNEESRKAVVLMTDGNFLLSYSEATSRERARRACDNMKEKGVLVYAVAFGAGQQAQDLFQDCATSDDFFFNADNEAELVSAFERIGGQLGELRLVN